MMPEMPITETLFGGVLLAAVLFFTGRRVGLPNFWASILSGALPFALYMAYSTQHAVGGDVLAIHFAVYLASAGLLMVFGGMQKKRQKLHWGPRLIIGFFVGLIALQALLLSISIRGLPDSISGIFLPNPNHIKLHTSFPGLVPHDLNKLYEPHLEQLEQQRKLGWQINLDGLKELHEQKTGKLTVTVLDKQQQPLQTAQVSIGMWRMANSHDDHKLSLQEIKPGVYQSEVLLQDAGRWIAELHIEHGSDSFVSQQTLFVSE